jgi:hypothetical protein
MSQTAPAPRYEPLPSIETLLGALESITANNLPESITTLANLSRFSLQWQVPRECMDKVLSFFQYFMTTSTDTSLLSSLSHFLACVSRCRSYAECMIDYHCHQYVWPHFPHHQTMLVISELLARDLYNMNRFMWCRDEDIDSQLRRFHATGLEANCHSVIEFCLAHNAVTLLTESWDFEFQQGPLTLLDCVDVFSLYPVASPEFLPLFPKLLAVSTTHEDFQVRTIALRALGQFGVRSSAACEWLLHEADFMAFFRTPPTDPGLILTLLRILRGGDECRGLVWRLIDMPEDVKMPFVVFAEGFLGSENASVWGAAIETLGRLMLWREFLQRVLGGEHVDHMFGVLDSLCEFELKAAAMSFLCDLFARTHNEARVAFAENRFFEAFFDWFESMFATIPDSLLDVIVAIFDVADEVPGYGHWTNLILENDTILDLVKDFACDISEVTTYPNSPQTMALSVDQMIEIRLHHPAE